MGDQKKSNQNIKIKPERGIERFGSDRSVPDANEAQQLVQECAEVITAIFSKVLTPVAYC